MKRRSLLQLLAGAMSSLALPAWARTAVPERVRREVRLTSQLVDDNWSLFAWLPSPSNKSRWEHPSPPPPVRVELLRMMHVDVFRWEVEKQKVLENFGCDLDGRDERLLALCEWWETAHAHGVRGLMQVPPAMLTEGRIAMAIPREGVLRMMFLEHLRTEPDSSIMTNRQVWRVTN